MNPITNRFSSIEQVTNQFLTPKSVNNLHQASDISFEDILKQQQSKSVQTDSELKFSKHAVQRLESRNITLSKDQSERLENGVKKADDKGIHESLVLIDSLAFIVNVPNKTVVTAMDQTETQSNIFTNIDGAVIM